MMIARIPVRFPVALLLVLFGLGGCVSSPAPPAPFPPPPAGDVGQVGSAARPPGELVRHGQARRSEPLPARLADPVGDACLGAIEEFAAAQTGGRVLLGPGAFRSSHELSLVRQTRRSPDGRLIGGRLEPSDAVVFSLFVRGDRCEIRTRDAEAALPACRCVPTR